MEAGSDSVVGCELQQLRCDGVRIVEAALPRILEVVGDQADATLVGDALGVAEIEV